MEKSNVHKSVAINENVTNALFDNIAVFITGDNIMTPQRFARIKAVLDRRQPDLTVVTDEVHKNRNLAAIIRNCDAVGIDQIHTVVPIHGYQRYSGTSASADKWVDVQQYSRIEEPLSALRSRGFQIVSANLSDSALDYRDIDYTEPTAVVLGAEVKGVSAASTFLSDAEIVLPMYGMVESYNVSVACALILSQAQTQRDAAGMYDKVRLPAAEYQRRFFQWAYPRIAKLCDEKEEPYPELDGKGALIKAD